jgi:hypothetical protein
MARTRSTGTNPRKRYIGAVDLGLSPAGTRIRKKVSGKTKVEVRDKFRELHKETDAGRRPRRRYPPQPTAIRQLGQAPGGKRQVVLGRPLVRRTPLRWSPTDRNRLHATTPSSANSTVRSRGFFGAVPARENPQARLNMWCGVRPQLGREGTSALVARDRGTPDIDPYRELPRGRVDTLWPGRGRGQARYDGTARLRGLSCAQGGNAAWT